VIFQKSKLQGELSSSWVKTVFGGKQKAVLSIQCGIMSVWCNPVSMLHSIVSTHSDPQQANSNVIYPLLTHSSTNIIYCAYTLELEYVQETFRNVRNFPIKFSSRNEVYMEY
jgi:hypothetical protein